MELPVGAPGVGEACGRDEASVRDFGRGLETVDGAGGRVAAIRNSAARALAERVAELNSSNDCRISTNFFSCTSSLAMLAFAALSAIVKR